MPTLKRLSRSKVSMYPGDHNPPHFNVFLWNWMARNSLTLDTAAQALGVSRLMLAYYRSGAKPVPRTVALACLGWEQARLAEARAFARAA